MMKDPFYEHLRELSWQRQLSAEEESRLVEWLARHPEAQADWDSEANLNRALDGLADVPVPSNFTARAVAAAQREADAIERANQSRGIRAFRWLPWFSRAAVAAVVLAGSLLSYHHIQEVRREQVAHSLAAVSEIPSVPDPEVLKDFDAIAALGSTPVADEELLKVMQ